MAVMPFFYTLHGALPASLERFDLAHMHERDLSRPSLRVLGELVKDFGNTHDAKELLKKGCQKYHPLLMLEGCWEDRDACVCQAASALPKRSEDIVGLCAYGLLLSRLATLYQELYPEQTIPRLNDKERWRYAITRSPELEKINFWKDALLQIMQYIHLPYTHFSWAFDLRDVHNIDIPLRLHGVHEIPLGDSLCMKGPSHGEMLEVITLRLYGLSLCPPLRLFDTPPLSKEASFVDRGAYAIGAFFSPCADNHADEAFTDIVLTQLRTVWDATLDNHDSCQTLTTGFVLSALLVVLEYPTESLQSLLRVVPSRKFFVNRENLSALHEHIDVGYVMRRINQETIAKDPECLARKDEAYRQCVRWRRQKRYDKIVNYYIEQSQECARCFDVIDRCVLHTKRLTQVVEQFDTVFMNIMGLCLDCVTEQCLLGAQAFCAQCVQNGVKVMVLSRAIETADEVKATLSFVWRAQNGFVSEVITTVDLLYAWKSMMGLKATTKVFLVGEISSACKANILEGFTETSDVRRADIVMVAKTTEELSAQEKGYIDQMVLNDTPALPLNPCVRVVRDGRPQTVPHPFISAFCTKGGRVFSFMDLERSLFLHGLQRQDVRAESTLVVTDEVVRLRAAKSLDMAAVLLESGSYKRGDALPVRPDYFSEGLFLYAAALSAH